MPWKCPECGSTDLQVEIDLWATLTQSEDNFETEIIEGDHEWDDDSWMMCRKCRMHGPARDFEVPE